MAKKHKAEPQQPEALNDKNPVEEAEVKEAAAKAAESAETGEQPAEEVSVDAVQAELEQARAEAADAKDMALRAKAEAQNARRRAEQDVEKAHKFALDKFTAELLPVVDSLERAIEAANDGDDAAIKAMREGVELTLNMFLSTLKKFNVEPVDPAGEPFDPQLHQAMSMVEKPDVEPNTVIHVMQKGYVLNERLVRPAMVMVSKAPQDSPKIDEQA